jgi:hypothetical protein
LGSKARALAAAVMALTGAAFAQESKPATSPATKPGTAPATRPAESKPREEEFLAIVNGDVETVTLGRLKGATVLVKGTKIWKVGRNVEIPEGAKRIDAAGMWVYPGMVVPRASNIGLVGFGAGGKLADRYDPFSLDVLGTIAAGITTVYQNETVMKIQTRGIDDLVIRENASLRVNLGSGQQRL